MSRNEPDEESPGLNFNDILFILFRRKKIILLCALAGIGLALFVYLFTPPTYESEAKLFVRYVVERSAIDAVDSQVRSGSDNLVNSEVEILKSRDLATQVASAVTLERMFPNVKGSVKVADAAREIQGALIVTPLKGTNIIVLSYKNVDAELAHRVLDELVVRYLTKHLEVHRSLGAFEFVSQQKSETAKRLAETEDQLMRAKSQAGVISLSESATALNTELTKSGDELRMAETEEAEQKARVAEIERWFGESLPASTEAPPPRSVVQRYEMLGSQIGGLRKAEAEMLSKYTPSSERVQIIRSQIGDYEGQRIALEKKYPGLAATGAAPGDAQDARPDLIGERARLASIQAKVNALKSRQNLVQAAIQRFAEDSPRIEQLERQKELQETNFKYFEASLEKARIDEALDPTKIPNISVVQKPTSPVRAISEKKKKIVLGFAGGGLGLGIALALLMELLVDRSVKRPVELKAQMHIPLLCSIPNVEQNGDMRMLSFRDRRDNQLGLLGSGPEAPWAGGHFIRSFADEIRARLILYFELKRTKHKPKLVALTGCSEGAGASTLAGGLAAALSETTEGKVLLVDMRDANTEMNPYFNGQPIFSLSDALDSGGALCAAADNLYLATAALPVEERASLSPREFYNMMPRFKASEFDYVIFDMPSMEQSSSALAIARFMDKVLLVIESEKSNRESVRSAYSELRVANANVSAILNKTRSYTPSWLGMES